MPVGRLRSVLLFLGAVLAVASPAAAQQPVTEPTVVPAAPEARVQTAVEALAQDAAEYARLYEVPMAEAMLRLRAQEESVAATNRIAATYRDRLAGISIQHRPDYRIVVLLTGTEPVPDEHIIAGGKDVPIEYRTGATATRDRMIAAIRDNQVSIRNRFPMVQGVGVDQVRGVLVAMASPRQADRYGRDALAADLTELAGLPVTVHTLGAPDVNMSVDGGARLEGVEKTDGRRYACTSGFVVTDAGRTGIITAAHCPYSLTYLDPAGGRVPLEFVGAWGARFQDVQVQASTQALRPLFYSDTAKTVLRGLASWRNRDSTRAGDFVCHRGEKTGYSCAEVELVDYAPPAPLCAGFCDPVWVTVAGPTCKSGDSGGPVFSGGIAFGIVKGGSYRSDGACNFYYYMSTDYLPSGWTLLHEGLLHERSPPIDRASSTSITGTPSRTG